MRIISDFKDYYDFLSDPSDTNHIWNRKTEIITIHKNDPDFKNFNNYYSNLSPYTHSIIGSRTWSKSIKEFNRDTIEFRTSLLMFCGNPYIIMTTSEQPDRYFYFGKDDFEQIVKEHSAKNSRSHFWIKGNISAYESIMQGNMPHYLKNINLNFKCPIIYIKHIDYYDNRFKEFRFEIELNSSLKSIQFEKLIDPYNVFQSLDRYIWNDLAATNDIADNISNQDKIESHGFDKWSFRKQSSKN